MKTLRDVPVGGNAKVVKLHGEVHNVKFLGGCNGNLQGIAALVEGQPPRNFTLCTLPSSSKSKVICREQVPWVL